MKSKTYAEHLKNGDVVRIVNNRQAATYWLQYGIEPLSIYPGEDFKTGKPVVVYVFSKEETKEAYKEWINNRPEVSHEDN